MKIKTLTFSLFLCISTISFSQNIHSILEETFSDHKFGYTPQYEAGPFDCKPDSILSFRFDSPVDSALETIRYLFYYDESAIVNYRYSVPSSLLSLIDSIVFDSDERIIYNEKYYYDATGDSLFLDNQTWNYYFENTTLLDSTIKFETPSNSTIIEPNSRINYERETDGRLMKRETLIWENSVWAPSEKENFYYPTGNSDYYSILSNWNGTEYIAMDSTIYEYDIEGNPLLFLTYSISDNTFISKQEYTYDAMENTTTQTVYYWNIDNQEWRTSYIVQTKLNEMENVVRLSYLLFSFMDGVQYLTFYPNESNCKFYEDREYTFDHKTWTIGNRIYFLPKILYSNSNNKLSPALEVFPNPTQNGIHIQTQPNSFFEIYTMQGQLIKKGISSGNEYIPFNISASTNLILKVQKDGAYSSEIIQVIR